MSWAATFPIEASRGSSPATVSIAAGACSHMPRHGLSCQTARPFPGCEPSGPIVRSSSATSSCEPRQMQATSVHTCATTGGCGSIENSA
jgi:hypothetical protein